MKPQQDTFKILFDARMLGFSGIGTQVENVLRRLLKEPSLDLRLAGNPELILELFPDAERRCKITEFRAPIYSLSEQFGFPELEPGETLHAPHYNAPVARLPRTVVVLHDLIHLQSKEFAKPHYRLYSYAMLSMVAWRAQRIVTVSETTRLEFLKRFPRAASRTRVIHNGISHKLFGPCRESEIKAFRKKYQLPSKFLLTVGIGKRHKNVDFLVRALAPEWKSAKLKMPLVLGGAGGELPDYVAEAARCAGVTQHLISMPHLAQEELPLLYAAARVFVMPSLYEGFGFPLAEAMACGTPALASHASSLPEVGGDAALYFDPRDEDSLRARLQQVLKDRTLREKLVKEGFKNAKRFQWKEHARALLEVYRDAAGE